MKALYRPVKIGSLELSGNLFAAPVAGYSDRAFRSLCAGLGASLSFTELASAEAIYRKPGHYGLSGEGGEPVPAAASLIARGDGEAHYAVQLFAAEPSAIYKAGVLLAPLKPDALDINCCCPAPKIVRNGCGSALMKEPAKLGRVVEAAARASREALGGVPVTLKMLSGWDSGSVNYAECARAAVEAGAAMVALHPRTRSQGYSGKSDWSQIADLVTRVSVPVTGSGDLYTPGDAKRMLEETGCAAVMFARGAMGNPFIFPASRALLTGEGWQEASLAARLDAALRHLELLAGYIGERAACLEMRKQFCAYTKAFPKGVALREEFIRAATVADYRSAAARYFSGQGL